MQGQGSRGGEGGRERASWRALCAKLSAERCAAGCFIGRTKCRAPSSCERRRRAAVGPRGCAVRGVEGSKTRLVEKTHHCGAGRGGAAACKRGGTRLKRCGLHVGRPAPALQHPRQGSGTSANTRTHPTAQPTCGRCCRPHLGRQTWRGRGTHSVFLGGRRVCLWGRSGRGLEAARRVGRLPGKTERPHVVAALVVWCCFGDESKGQTERES